MTLQQQVHSERSTRHAFTLLELIIVIAIIALMIGLLLPAITSVRVSAQVVNTSNNLRQNMLGVHQLSTVRDGEIKQLPPNDNIFKWRYSERSIFALLVPYVHGEMREPDLNATEEEHLNYSIPLVKSYLDPVDPSLYDQYNFEVLEGRNARVSYAANMMVFDRFVSMNATIRDGHSNTIGFTTHYFHCGNGANTKKSGNLDWKEAGAPWPSDVHGGGDRRATFADSGYYDVHPVRDPATGKTVASTRGVTFEVRPTVMDANCHIPQAFYARGMQVVMFDGSVHTLRQTIDETIFWSMVTPAGGETFEMP
jgi:prepilin-type N-terminal cleavage/methylation domain-containing protein